MHPVEGSVAAFVHAVRVVQVAGAVHTEANQKAVLLRNQAPLLVEQDAVGLKGVGDVHMRGAAFLLKLDGPSEEVEAPIRVGSPPCQANETCGIVCALIY